MALQSRWPGRTVPRWLRVTPVLSSCHQHLAVGQQRRRVIDQRAVVRLPVAVQSRWPGRTVPRSARLALYSPCHQHLAVGQQRRRVRLACGVEAAGGSPRPAGRVVQFRAAKSDAAGIYVPLPPAPCRWAATSPCDDACGGEAAGGSPGPAGRVVQFRAGKNSRRYLLPLPPAPCRWAATSPCDQSRAVLRLPVALQVPLAGSYSSALLRELTPLSSPCHQHLAVGQQRRRVISSVRC